MVSKSLALTKLVATGNDFLFVNALAPVPSEWPIISRERMAQILCDRHFGIGADGLVFVESARDPKRPELLKWDFYNNDGSSAEMCGNATRCMGRWSLELLGKDEIEFLTTAGVVRVQARGRDFVSELSFAPKEPKTLAYIANGISGQAALVDTGVPHAVVELPDIALARRSAAIVDALRFHPQAGPRGTNVTFFSRQAIQDAEGASAADAGVEDYHTVTFERGVEGFTLSCGTGVLAAAAIGLRGTGHSCARLETPGGVLQVEYPPGRAVAKLTGEARLTFQTKIDLSSSLYEKLYGVES